MQIYCSLRGPGGLWLGEGWNRVFCCFWWRGVSAAGCFLPDSGMLFLAELVGLWSLEGMGNCSVHALSTVSQWWTFSYSFWGMGVVFCGPEQNFWLGRFLIWTLEVSSFENRWWPKNLENWLLANFEVRYFRFWGLNRESARLGILFWSLGHDFRVSAFVSGALGEDGFWCWFSGNRDWGSCTWCGCMYFCEQRGENRLRTPRPT